MERPSTSPSRRSFFAVSAAVVVGAATPQLAGALIANPMPVVAADSVAEAISLHRDVFDYANQLLSNLFDLEENTPGSYDLPRVNLGYSLCLSTGAKNPIWAYSSKEIDRHFDKRLGGIWAGDEKASAVTNVRRARAHAEFAEDSRRVSEAMERAGLTLHRNLVKQFQSEEDRVLNDLISLSLNSIDEVRAVAKHLCECVDEIGDLDFHDPLHCFVASLAGITANDKDGQ